MGLNRLRTRVIAASTPGTSNVFNLLPRCLASGRQLASYDVDPLDRSLMMRGIVCAEAVPVQARLARVPKAPKLIHLSSLSSLVFLRLVTKYRSDQAKDKIDMFGFGKSRKAEKGNLDEILIRHAANIASERKVPVRSDNLKPAPPVTRKSFGKRSVG